MTDAPPSTPDLFARLKHEMERPPYHHLFLRPRPVSVDAQTGTVVIALPYRPEFRHDPNADGYHGGVLAALIDLAAHAAIAVQIGRPAPTIDLRIDYLRPAPGTDLTAIAKLLRVGGAIARADVEIAGADGKVVAVGRGTFSTRA